MDRSPFSLTYGCFDKNYWHFKTKDYPAGTFQLGAEFLARLWATNDRQNPYYQNEEIKNWAIAAFEFTLSIQHKDGSFDEWYPNERGWAGPTSYIIHSLFECYKILENEFSQSAKEKLKVVFSRSGKTSSQKRRARNSI